MAKRLLFISFVFINFTYSFSQMVKIDIAEFIYDELYNNPPDSYEASTFPNPFFDLDNNLEITKKVKILSYLEYDDDTTCFYREGSFNSSTYIQRVIVLAYMMEAWNIPTAYSPTSPFLDVDTNMAYYEYVVGAHDAGIIGGDFFRPWDIATYNDVAYDFMTGIANSSYHPVSESILQNMDNYFSPNNYTPYNYGVNRGLEQGVFSHYAKNSFIIPDIKMNLNFSHYYSNTMVEIDDSFFPIKPLGRGWSHTYNSFVLRNIVDGNIIFTIKWADGTIHIWDDTELEYITKGVYNGFTYGTGDDELSIRTKNQTRYTFEKIDNDLDIFYLIEIEDRNDNRIKIEYESAEEDDKERIEYVEAPSGKRLYFNYHSNTDLIEEITDPIRSIEFSYYQDRLRYFYDAKSQDTKYYYLTNDGSGSTSIEHFLLDRIRLPRGNNIYAEYDNDEKLKSYQINSNSPVDIDVEFNYGGGNDEIISDVSVPMPEGGTQNFHFEYNQNGMITEFQNNTDDISISYPSSGININRPSNTNINGLDIDYQYDSDGNIKKITTENEIEERFWYNSDNDITKYRDANGNDTEFFYTNGNLTSIKDALNNYSYLTYDNYGQLESRTNQEGITINYTYEDDGVVETIIAPEGMSASFNYDGVNRLLTKIVNGQTSSYTYDPNDNIETQTNIGGFTTTFNYDENDNLASITNTNNVSTTFTYNDEDQVTSETFGSLVKEYEYNDDGTLDNYIKPSGNVIHYDYLSDGKLNYAGTITDIDYYGSNDGKREGLIESIATADIRYNFNYDNLNRLVEVEIDNEPDLTVRYGYDDIGNITRIYYPNSPSNFYVRYYYDAKNRLIDINITANGITKNIVKYNYRNDDKISSIFYRNSDKYEIEKGYNYDDVGRLTGVFYYKSPVGGGIPNLLYHQSIELDNRGNIVSDISRYDTLEEEQNFNSQAETYTYNSTNHITQAGNEAISINNDGNTTQKGSINYQYNIDDKLTNITGNNGTSNINFQLKYDPYGNRIEKDIIDGTTFPETRRYVWDIINNNIIKEYNPNGSEQYFYVYGASGLEFSIFPNSGTIGHFFHGDIRGSVVFRSNTNGDVVANYFNKYDDFGNITTYNSPDAEVYGAFYYLGKHGIMNDVTAYDGLYQVKARYYDAKLGRFLTQDPIWSTNLYPYANNNPISNIDRNGKFLEELTNQAYDITGGYIANNFHPDDIDFLYSEIEYWAEGRHLGTGIVDQSFNYYENLYIQNYISEKSTLSSQVGMGFTSLWRPNSYQSTLAAFTLKPADATKVTKWIGKTGYLKLFDMRRKFGRSLKKIYQYFKLYDKTKKTINKTRRY
jgi:RHS repeat-associated protein